MHVGGCDVTHGVGGDLGTALHRELTQDARDVLHGDEVTLT